MARLRAHFNGTVLVPLEPVDLPTDRVLEIEVTDGGQLRRGSPALVLNTLRQAPHVPATDVDDLERAIEASKLPVKYDDVFPAGE
jgi:hypothetical protein